MPSLSAVAFWYQFEEDGLRPSEKKRYFKKSFDLLAQTFNTNNGHPNGNMRTVRVETTATETIGHASQSVLNSCHS